MPTRDYNVKARLRVEDLKIPITRFTLDFPEGSIGSKLTAELAEPDATVDPNSSMTFDIGIDSGNGVEWVPMMDVGKVRVVDRTIAWLDDHVVIEAISGLAERWDRSPSIPIVLYDPAQVDIVDESGPILGELVDVNHDTIEPEKIPIEDFDLLQLFNYVYVTKLGFTSVVTNIPNFPLKRADIRVTDSFHSVAAREIGIFEPVYHADDDTVLFIIDPQRDLPPGLSIRKLNTSQYVKFTTTRETGRNINAIILSYRDNTVPGSASEDRVEQSVQDVGTPFTAGWQRTVTNTFIRDFFDNPADPDEVTRSVPFRVDSRTVGFDGVVRELAIESQTDNYLYDFRLKTGYTKVVSLYTAFPGEGAAMRTVQTETNQVVWEELSSSPGEFAKVYEITSIVGTVLVEGEGEDITRTSLYQANRNSLVTDDMEVEVGVPIFTQIDRYRILGRDQIEVNTQKVDHLKIPPKPTITNTVQHTGTIQARAQAQSTEVNMLLVNDVPPEERRPPASLSAGNVPVAEAKALARRILDRRGTQPAKANVDLTGFDLALRRGSLRKIRDREGDRLKVFIKGFRIVGEQLGTPNFSVKQSVTGLVIETE